MKSCDCGGDGWVVDHNYQPDDYIPAPTPGQGLKPCPDHNADGSAPWPPVPPPVIAIPRLGA
jgi:hypothetical protein